MKKRIAISIAGVALFLVAYAFLGPYAIHKEECIRCGAWRSQFRIGNVTLLSIPRRTDLSRWYLSFDASHANHTWGSVCGAEHKWFRGRPGWGSYDNFGWRTAYALRALHDRQEEVPAEEFNRVMASYIAADVASITGGVWRLLRDREQESQQPDGEIAQDSSPSAAP